VKKVEIGTVVAERVLILDSDTKVIARIGLPYTPAEFPNESWCPWQIDGLGSAVVRRTIGIDSVQALWLAFQIVGSELYACDEYRSGRLVAFPGKPLGDLGFPTFAETQDLLPKGD
jgi:hypothetical protein